MVYFDDNLLRLENIILAVKFRKLFNGSYKVCFAVLLQSVFRVA
jgi:hypothetical protein